MIRLLFLVLPLIFLVYYLIKKEIQRVEELQRKAIQVGLNFKKTAKLDYEFLNSIVRNLIQGDKREYKINIFEYYYAKSYMSYFVFETEKKLENLIIDKKNFFTQSSIDLSQYPKFNERFFVICKNDSKINPELIRYYENLDSKDSFLFRLEVKENKIIFSESKMLNPSKLSEQVEKIFKVLYYLEKE